VPYNIQIATSEAKVQPKILPISNSVQFPVPVIIPDRNLETEVDVKIEHVGSENEDEFYMGTEIMEINPENGLIIPGQLDKSQFEFRV